ncbi:unnamed protein product [Didymodactylos carnosus]|uniref:Protein-L-isoaspartate(D-aspartate) O-methyltransferase n=2 Tax=Didymodactylos carnosus TaxID=1234261 RepID=A0A8S2IHQ5_9BILA|nr:unnamed protein product [Didymodactylos carnosus]CAF3729931.1 unnamed protein product [Didymodactylos carnosus]
MAEAQLTNQLSRIGALTNVELRAELKRRGCSSTGNKKDLLARLRAAMQKEFDQQVLDTASTTSTIGDSASERSVDERISNNDTELNASSFMTPTALSPQIQNEQQQQTNNTEENPLTYSNLMIHDQANPQYPAYDLSSNQHPQPNTDNVLDLSSSSSHNTRRKRPNSTPGITSNTPERKRTRTREKKNSVDAPAIDFEKEQQETSALTAEKEEPISVSPTVEEPPNVQDNQPQAPTNVGYNIEEVNADQNNVHHEVRQQQDEDNLSNVPVIDLAPDDIDDDDDLTKIDGDRSRSPSTSSRKRKSPSVTSSVKSESVINEMPLSGERHRLSRSKSPKSRWRHSPSPSQPNQSQHQQQSKNIDEEQEEEENINDNSIITTDESKDNPVSQHSENVSKSSENQEQQVTLFAEEMSELVGQKEVMKHSLPNVKDDEQKQQHPELKPSRSQTSTLIKGLHKSNNNRCLNLSSNTLIPDIRLGPAEVLDADLEAIGSENDERNGTDRGASPIPPNEREFETSIGGVGETMTIGELEIHIENGLNAASKQKRTNDLRRTVIMDVNADASSLLNDDSLKKFNNIQPPVRILSHESKSLHDGKTSALMMDEPMRVKDVTPSNQPPSKILYIRGLTRPFTVPQLKELLSRYGTLVDGDFWVDKIKSQCFVTYDSLEEAQCARESLDGCRWPSSNPKTMVVRFAKLEFSKTNDAPPDQMSLIKEPVASLSFGNRLVQEKPITKPTIRQDRDQKAENKSELFTTNTNDKHKQDKMSPSNPSIDKNNRTIKKSSRSSDQNNVREWDSPKLQPHSPSSPPISSARSPSTQLQAESNESRMFFLCVATTQSLGEAPAKVLDDYFRKTKSKPAVYWLPLNDEQVLEKIRVDEQKKKEKEDERKKRDDPHEARQKESHQTAKSSRSNNEYSKHSKHSHQSNEKTSSRHHRRSVSPSKNTTTNTNEQSISNRDKRKRLSSSPFPTERENKRQLSQLSETKFIMSWMSSSRNTHEDLISTLQHQHIIKDPRVKQAMLETDRIDFSTDRLYQDSPQPIGFNVTISAPHMHAYALEMLKDKLIPGAKVLDVGSGSGFLTACMARMVQGNGGKVIGIEHIPQLVDISIKNINKHGSSLFDNGTLKIVQGDGRYGYEGEAPYDVIHVGAASPDVPHELLRQLNVGGRLVVPVGADSQKMMEYNKLENGQIREKAHMGVRYVPLTSQQQQLKSWR